MFYEICSLIAPQYFDDGELVLESACDNICHWPALDAGESLTLHLLGTVFQTVIPKMNSKTNGNAQSNNDAAGTHLLDNAMNQLPPQVLSSVHEIDIFRSLFSVLTHIHLLWELVLTGEPIVVMGASPTDCSLMVQSLMRWDFFLPNFISIITTIFQQKCFPFQSHSTDCLCRRKSSILHHS